MKELVKAKHWEVITISLSALVLTILGIIGFLGLYAVDLKPSEEDYITIKVYARQFAWRFEYPNGETSAQLTLEAGKLYKLELNSEDVIHSLYIKELGIKRDVVPGMTNIVWLKVNKPGEFNIFCAEFCGAYHYSMITKLKVK
ncbi:Cytochrome c oxidase subunit 2 [archaeon HR06]|nr:Cytochrome c oxidase subunit 2 [archaeon HR06]